MSIVTASGIFGSSSNNNTGSRRAAGIGFPQNLPHAFVVGGSSVSYSPQTSSWVAERAWNNSGGGISNVIPLPWYQRQVPGLVSKMRRNIPGQ
jgi:subtilase family serine protease